jgi:hypothetical protein
MYVDAVTALASGRMTWHRNDPALYEKEKAEVEAHFPDLHFVVESDIVCAWQLSLDV